MRRTKRQKGTADETAIVILFIVIIIGVILGGITIYDQRDKIKNQDQEIIKLKKQVITATSTSTPTETMSVPTPSPSKEELEKQFIDGCIKKTDIGINTAYIPLPFAGHTTNDLEVRKMTIKKLWISFSRKSKYRFFHGALISIQRHKTSEKVFMVCKLLFSSLQKLKIQIKIQTRIQIKEESKNENDSEAKR